VIVTVTALPFFLLVTLTLEPKGSDLWAAVIALSQQARHAVLRIMCQVEGGSTYHPRHSKRRSNGRRRHLICNLQSNQKWTAPGLQTEWWQLRNLSHGLRSATAPFVPFSSSRACAKASKKLQNRLTASLPSVSGRIPMLDGTAVWALGRQTERQPHELRPESLNACCYEAQ
jgi:hypothetical protein